MPENNIKMDLIPSLSTSIKKKSLKKKIKEIRLSVKIALFILIVLSFCTFFAELVAPYDPYNPNLEMRNQPPSFEHIFGNDQVGRDILSRTIFAIRTSVGIALVGIFFGTLIGVTFGITAGLLGGWADRIISSVIDFFYSIPNLLIMLVGVGVLGTKVWVLILLISFARWHSTARLIRGQVLSLRELPAVEAAAALGGSNFYIAAKHIFPNLISVLIVNMTLKFPGLILLESTLSFLGLGVQPPLASLGAMVGQGRGFLFNAPWVSLVPAFCIMIIVMCFQVVGDWIRDISDVQQSD